MTCAVVLAAGTGRRLAPLTRYRAKPLLPLPGGSPLDRQLDQLEAAGVMSALVNTHHRPGDFTHLRDRHPGLQVELRCEAELTGPAGALRAFRDRLADEDTFLVVSGDVVHDLDLAALAAFHASHDGALTFCAKRVRRASRYGVLEIAPDGRVVSFVEKQPLPPEQEAWVSCGLYVVDAGLIEEIPPGCIYDYKDIAARMLAADRPIYAYRWDGYWNDVGEATQFVAASLDLVAGRPTLARPGIEFVDPSAVIDEGARVDGDVWVGARVRVASGGVVEGPAVLHDDVRVEADAVVRLAVLLPGWRVASGALVDGGLVGEPERLAVGG